MSLVNELLATMTLEEKVGQLNMVTAGHAVTGPGQAGDVVEGIKAGRVGSILNLSGAEPIAALQKIAVEETRLGIPLLVGFDVLHGQRTIFPIPLGEAASFDPLLWKTTARTAAVEAAEDGIAMTFAPMLDVARDPRWGRIAESPGEDPLVGARFAEAKVQGFQGADLAAAGSLAATAKHFCAYGAATAGRDYAPVDLSERLLHEAYLPPFAAAVAAGAAAVMPSFNDIAGTPMTVHKALLQGWLREKQGFDGVIVSDYHATAELLTHGVAADLAEAAALALSAGVDIDMMGNAYVEGLPVALARGLVTIEAIDAAVRRVLVLKERLGLFEDAFRRGAPRLQRPAEPEARRTLAREAARRSIVLLTNNGILPLAQGPCRVALVGPLADASAEMLGPWAAGGDPKDPVGIRAGLAAAFPGSDIAFAPGVGISDTDVSGIAAARDLCARADLVILCVGEAASMSGEAACRADPGLPGRQDELARAVLDLGKPVVVLVSSGRPLTIPFIVDRADAVLATWFLGSEAGHAIGDVLSGRFNPVGRLPVTWPRHVGQVPIFYAQRPSGRPAVPGEAYSSKYLDMPNEPEFCFGHGLSFTDFRPSSLRASPQCFRHGDEITLEVDVTNTGPVAGEETVFFFLRDPVARIARPVLELVAFAKIALSPGETGTVTVALPGSAFCGLGPDLGPCLEPGEFVLYAGKSADRNELLSIKLEALAD